MGAIRTPNPAHLDGADRGRPAPSGRHSRERSRPGATWPLRAAPAAGGSEIRCGGTRSEPANRVPPAWGRSLPSGSWIVEPGRAEARRAAATTLVATPAGWISPSANSRRDSGFRLPDTGPQSTVRADESLMGCGWHMELQNRELPRPPRPDTQSARIHAGLSPRIFWSNARPSRKSGMTTSAPTPRRRWYFHASKRPEPLWASSLATATAKPPTSLVFWIST